MSRLKLLRRMLFPVLLVLLAWGTLPNVTLAAPLPLPSNDLYANNELLSSGYSKNPPYSQAIDGSTVSGSDPAMTCLASSHNYVNTVWFRYHGINSRVTISTIGSEYDTVIGVYTGSPGSFVQRACNDNASSTLQSSVNFNMTFPTTYYIMVANKGSTPASLGTT